MKQFAVIGLGSFGSSMVDEISEYTGEILIVDRDPEMVERYKDKVANAFIADAINEEAIKRIIPRDLDAAIVDLGDSVEAAILVTNHLKKLGVKSIVVKALSEAQGEVLKLVGADSVVFPDREASRRLAPMLLSSFLFNFIPLSAGLVMAEVLLPERFKGMTLIEANLRQKYSLNVIAFRKEAGGDYDFFNPGHKLQPDEILLIAGKEEDIISFTGKTEARPSGRGMNIFRKLMGKRAKEEK